MWGKEGWNVVRRDAEDTKHDGLNTQHQYWNQLLMMMVVYISMRSNKNCLTVQYLQNNINTNTISKVREIRVPNVEWIYSIRGSDRVVWCLSQNIALDVVLHYLPKKDDRYNRFRSFIYIQICIRVPDTKWECMCLFLNNCVTWNDVAKMQGGVMNFSGYPLALWFIRRCLFLLLL